MDREYDPGKREFKKTLYFAGVVIGDNQILPNLSAFVLASILSLFINSKLDLSFTFFSPAAIKISCVQCSWRFCLRKKSVANAKRNDELSIPLPHSFNLVAFSSIFLRLPPPSPAKRYCLLRLFWIIACIAYIKLKGTERSLRPDVHLTEWQLTAFFSTPFRQH